MKNSRFHPLQNIQGIFQDAFWLQLPLFQSCQLRHITVFRFICESLKPSMLLSVWIRATTTTAFVLMPLSWLARVGNFCFNLLSPFLSIVPILSSQAISFQILLYTLFPRFPGLTLLPFPIYFKLHNVTYLGVDVSMDDMTIPSQMALNYRIFDLHNKTTLSQRASTSVDTLWTSLTPLIILIIQRSTPRNLTLSATGGSHVLQ